MKDEEGTIRQDSQTGEKAKTVATAAGTGAVVGGLSNGVKGGLIGAGIGGGIGTAIGLLTRGNDVRMEAGTTLEMVIQREVPLDGNRVAVTEMDCGVNSSVGAGAALATFILIMPPAMGTGRTFSKVSTDA